MSTFFCSPVSHHEELGLKITPLKSNYVPQMQKSKSALKLPTLKSERLEVPLVLIRDQQSIFKTIERNERPVLKLRQISNMDNIKGVVDSARYKEDVHKLLECKTESRLAIYEKLQLSHREQILSNKAGIKTQGSPTQ